MLQLKISLVILVIIHLISVIGSEDVNSLNDSENESKFIESQNKNFTDLKTISDILDVFNIHKLGRIWSHVEDHYGPNCSKDLNAYLEGLRHGKIWAMKMDDATGHYSNGFLYGNNYWTGSMSLCTSIYKDEDNVFEDDNKPSGNGGFSINKHHDSTSQTAQIQHENPPFRPGFFVLTLNINETDIAPTPRQIYVGLCLPSSCSLDNVKNLTRDTQNEASRSRFDYLAIRSPTQNRYNYWSDSTFVIITIVTVLVTALLTWGTIYDILLTRRYKEKLMSKVVRDDSEASSGIGCTTYDLSGSMPNKNDLAIGIPRGINNNNSDENLAVESQDEEKLGICSELLLSFSIITNFKAICDRSVGNDTIPSIHGLRAISMAWVILGHTCIVVFKYSDNMGFRKIIEKEFMFQTISNGAFSVDTFFFLSGFLISFIYFRSNAKGKLEKLSQGVNEFTAGTFHFLGLILYRFMRLTTPYIYVLGIVEIANKYFANYSVFDPPTLDHVNCPKFWWRNILYINTLFPVEEMCMLWSWYLADDTQFYIIGAIILIIAVRHFKVAAGILAVFMISSWGTTAFIAFNNNHMPNTDDPLALFDKIYDKPWTRLGPYLVGMCVGWLLFKTNCKIKMSKPAVVTGWSLSTASILYLIYGLYNTELSAVSAAAYSSLSHSVWAVSLGWIVVACSTGHGGYVNKLLSASCIYPFSRVTYCAYLVHPIVIRFLALNSDSPLHLGTDSMVIIFFGQAVLSYILAFVVSLSFEAPVVTMLKILTPNRKKRLV